MKKGGASSRRLSYRPVRAGAAVVGGERCSSLYRLLAWEDMADGSSLRWRSSLGTVRRPGGRWRLWERRVGCGEHVPDRFGEPAGEVDLRDLGAALFTDARFHVLVALAVGGVGAGMGGGLDQRPAEVAGSVLGERAAAVGLTGLVDARAEAAVAGELARAGEAADVAEFGGDRVGEHPADPGDGAEQRHVAVVGAEAA